MNDEITEETSEEETIARECANAYAEQYHKPRGGKLEDFCKDDGLGPAEERLLYHCQRGTDCVISGNRPDFPTEENRIRASFLRYLILGGCEKVSIHQRGVTLYGAFIVAGNTPEGRGLDLESAVIEQDFHLIGCNIEGMIFLRRAKVQSIFLSGSKCDGIKGDGLETKGGVFLRAGFHANGVVRLLGASIGSDFTCSNGRFVGLPISLDCDGMETKGNVFLQRGFCAIGEVRFMGANLGGVLSCIDAKLEGLPDSLSCAGITVGGDVFLREGFVAAGNVLFSGAIIGGQLSCTSSYFKQGLYAGNATISENIFLSRGFQSRGVFNFSNTRIKGSIYGQGGYAHSKHQAILANRAEIDGSVELGGFNSAGTISFQNANIKGNFSVEGATLSSKPCLSLRNSKIGGELIWRGLKHVGGKLDLAGASAKVISFDMKSWLKPSEIKLNNFKYEGFTELERDADSEYWRNFLKQQPRADLTYKFRPGPWDQLARVLDSMGYESEARSMRIRKEHRLTRFISKYEPAARSGFKLMHRLNVIWRYLYGFVTDHGYRPGKVLFFLMALIAAGWGTFWHAAKNDIMAPTHPLIFKEAREGGMIPERCEINWVHFVDNEKDYLESGKPVPPEERCQAKMPSEYSEFSPLFYSADVVLPIINLRQQDDWSPRVVNHKGIRDWYGYAVRFAEWLFIGLGWALSLIFVSAVGGIIRR